MEFTTSLRLERQAAVVATPSAISEPPAECYESCSMFQILFLFTPDIFAVGLADLKLDYAYLEAQTVGQSVGLCAENSDFNLYYSRCYSCILAVAENSRETISNYFDPMFYQYIAYCQKQKGGSVDPSWYTSTTTWAVATYTMQSGPTVTVTVLVDTTVIRPDWTGFQTTTPVLPTTATPDKPNTDGSRNGPSPWVWAIVGAVIALALIGLGILLLLYRKGKLRSLKQKWKLGRVSAHTHELDGDSTWRTGDKPELHGESRLMAAVSSPVKEIYTKSVEPKELDSSVRPVELAVDDIGTMGRTEVAELPAEVTSSDQGGGERCEGEPR